MSAQAAEMSGITEQWIAPPQPLQGPIGRKPGPGSEHAPIDWSLAPWETVADVGLRLMQLEMSLSVSRHLADPSTIAMGIPKRSVQCLAFVGALLVLGPKTYRSSASSQTRNHDASCF